MVLHLNDIRQKDGSGPELLSALLALCVLIVAMLNASSVLATPAYQSDIKVHVDEAGLVSVSAVNAPLNAVIDAIRPQVELEIQGSISAEDRVTADFQSLPLEKAIAKLTDRYIVVHDEAGGPVTRVVLFRQGEAIALPQAESPARQLNTKALTAWKHGDILAARDYFEAAVASNPEDWLPRADYGRLLVLMTNYDEAGPQLTRAAALDPENPRIWLDLYSYYQRTLQLDLALNARKRAHELAGENTIEQHRTGLWKFENDSIFPES